MQVEQELPELLASRDDGTGGDGKFLECVFRVGGGAKQRDGIIRMAAGHRRPRVSLLGQDADLRRPIGSAVGLGLNFAGIDLRGICASQVGTPRMSMS